ncbi:MAG: iron uptake porin [Coleofasciculus sp. C1-SOL-03]|uniref:iron uptake porin n=1 Tax=Coleofasciculus sp. C1-SOL-03 TaxID=3069522 RepID=UPI0032FA52C3
MGTSTATVAEETESSSTILIEDASFRGDGGDEGDGGDGEDFSASDATMSHNLVIESVHPDSTMGEERQHPMAQITNVSELRDVQPTDWAYEALRSLIQRYDCIAGYPDDTYRGNVALTRFEFAAGLNACLQQIEHQIITSTEDGVNPDDLAGLQRLVTEFEAELATLNERVDSLDRSVAVLADNQFSTTTKLTGNVFSNLTGAFANGDIQAEGLSAFATGRDENNDPVVRQITNDPEITLSYLVFLNLNTSFSGKDNLTLQLVAGNGNSPANEFVSAGLFNTFGVPFTDQQPAVNANDLVIRELFYSFPLRDRLQLVVGPQVNWYRHFDLNRFTFFLTGTSSFNSIGSTLLNTLDRGVGAVAIWDISEQLNLRVSYLAENTEFLPQPPFGSASDPDKGLFGGINTFTTELTVSPTDQLNLRFLYNRSRREGGFGLFKGGAQGEPIYGFADDGFGGELKSATADTFNFNFDWLISPGFGIFGRYSYGSTNLNPRTPGLSDGEVNVQALQLGVAFPDLGREGALATLSYQIPFSVLDGSNFLVSGGGDGGVQYEFEATYYYPLTNNLALVPAFYLIANPNNFSDNPTIYVGNIRTQFSF